MNDLRRPRTVKELCLVTGLSAPTVKAQIRDGQLPGYKQGRKYVIPAEAFDRYCEGIWEPRVITRHQSKPFVRDITTKAS